MLTRAMGGTSEALQQTIEPPWNSGLFPPFLGSRIYLRIPLNQFLVPTYRNKQKTPYPHCSGLSSPNQLGIAEHQELVHYFITSIG